MLKRPTIWTTYTNYCIELLFRIRNYQFWHNIFSRGFIFLSDVSTLFRNDSVTSHPYICSRQISWYHCASHDLNGRKSVPNHWLCSESLCNHTNSIQFVLVEAWIWENCHNKFEPWNSSDASYCPQPQELSLPQHAQVVDTNGSINPGKYQGQFNSAPWH